MVLVGIALSVFQQLVGINTVLYYGPEIFAKMGYHMDEAFLGTLVACMVNFMSTMIVVLIVDKVGRKPLLIFGGIIMGVSMLTLGSLFHSQHAGAFGLAALCLYLAGFAISFGPIVWIMMTEIYPAPIRGQAMSLAVASQWIANLLVSGTFPLLLGNDTLNGAWNYAFPFWLYGSFGIIAAFIVLRYVPETRGVDSDQLSRPVAYGKMGTFLISAVTFGGRSEWVLTDPPRCSAERQFRRIAPLPVPRVAPAAGPRAPWRESAPGAASQPACACC